LPRLERASTRGGFAEMPARATLQRHSTNGLDQ
jgi:hypothetical protein